MRFYQLLSFALLWPTAIYAGEFENLQFDNGNCNLTIAGTELKDVVYKGEKESLECQSVIDRAEFNKRYSYCAISSVASFKENEFTACRFGYYDSEHSRVYFSASPNSGCQFVCVKK